ncbi:hypothetical protein Celaphus_00007418, partial [Cervus elaphus hippelaphus]
MIQGIPGFWAKAVYRLPLLTTSNINNHSVPRAWSVSDGMAVAGDVGGGATLKVEMPRALVDAYSIVLVLSQTSPDIWYAIPLHSIGSRTMNGVLPAIGLTPAPLNSSDSCQTTATQDQAEFL